MISFNELKDIADEFGLDFEEDEAYSEWRMYIKNPIFTGRDVDSAVISVNFREQSIWVFNELDTVQYPWDYSLHWSLRVKGNSVDSDKIHRNKPKEFFRQVVKDTIQLVKRKQEELELDKIKGDF